MMSSANRVTLASTTPKAREKGSDSSTLRQIALDVDDDGDRMRTSSGDAPVSVSLFATMVDAYIHDRHNGRWA